jgi:hypothetical protein
MKQGSFLVLATLTALVGNIYSFAAEIPAQPEWMNSDLVGIDPPEQMSGADQDQCTRVILDEINTRTKISLTEDDVAPIKMPSWDRAERGFVRGGGFNIRIVTTLSERSNQLHHLHSGRFANFITWLKMGDEPSLHLPKVIDDHQIFFKSEDETGTHVDFVAHVDSAYALLPIGFFKHIFTDVVGADTRNPCPIVGGEDKNED